MIFLSSLLTISLALTLPSNSRIEGKFGATLSPCFNDTPCISPRKCSYADPNLHSYCPPIRSNCFCFDTAFSCNNSADCPEGELCALVPETTPLWSDKEPMCVSALTFAYWPDLKLVGADQKVDSDGLTLDPCRVDEDCASGRKCTFFAEDGTDVCEGGEQRCFCFPDNVVTCSAEDSSPCPSGESCVEATGFQEQFCASDLAVVYASTISKAQPRRTPTKPLKGVSYEPCRLNEGCETGHVCKAAAEKWPDAWEGCTDEKECYCLPPILESCRQSSDCSSRELCAGADSIEGTYCFSAVLVRVSSDLKEVDEKATDGSGLTLYPCVNSDSCRGSRTCVYEGENNDTPPCLEGKSCFCFSYRPCAYDEACESGELCIISEDEVTFCAGAETEAAYLSVKRFTPSPLPSTSISSSPTGSATPTKTPSATPTASATQSSSLSPSPSTSSSPSLSTTPTPSESPKDRGVCVDAELLRHLRWDQLVFDRHAYAQVLCDRNRSCATPGHMVVFHGKIMMMKSYCEVVTCEYAKMLVNSPRRTIGGRVKSRTNGLEFTHFAARYESKMEESVLRLAVHIRL